MDDFDKYIRQGEPNKSDKARAWQTAIGLQKVDQLDVSEYLIDTAKKHIEGDIKLADVRKLVNAYYKKKDSRVESDRTKEADDVSVRITELLSEQTFSMSPVGLISIHKHLFSGIYDHAGKIRDYNITKKEWVLDDDTVLYASASDLSATLDYDFAKEKQYNYAQHSLSESVAHIAKFISGIWQIHPFGEGNTRTTAVFLVKYLRTFGFNVNNDLFKENSWYFRNALVRANYTNLPKGITSTDKFLMLFFRNLILGEKNVLRNRDMHISFEKKQSAKSEVSKRQNGTLDCTLEELSVLTAIRENPKITQDALSAQIGKSLRTVKRIMASLQNKNLISRNNGRRNGYWEISPNVSPNKRQ